eukprot:TRINITY_DN6111_c0_g1_i4.p1 TRINITY_DN6111_c0_g1~~TRINITY_DN6111_c0_g1_i4.p1  ORF type:complete len:364 (+),score=46.01 TRINITY_DN6111_c0_g1_i4:75-1166(+)
MKGQSRTSQNSLPKYTITKNYHKKRSTQQKPLPVCCQQENRVWSPVKQSVAAFAPATVANLGPGFDWLGVSVDGPGDTVIAEILEGRPGEVVIKDIIGDDGVLSKEPVKNCTGIGAIETMKLMGGKFECGVSLTLDKGLQLGSGTGSSAASAAAGAWAVNALFGCPLTQRELIYAGLVSEATVSGYHADNIAPALLGGFTLIRSNDPLDVQQLKWPEGLDLYFVMVNPKFQAPTAKMRAVLPKEVPMSKVVHNCAWGASLVVAICTGDIPLLGKALDSDSIIEPARSDLIPGFKAVKQAAKDAGAFGCTISGAGPTSVAIVDNLEVAEKVSAAMQQIFQQIGGLEIASHRIGLLDTKGSRTIS